MNIIDVTAENAAKNGFFCKMSQKKCEGYKRKLQWLQQRFSEGMRIKMLDLKEGGRGFIEYIPGEYAWRAVNAESYMVIHCIWVVGSSKGKGYSSLLLNECIEDAKRSGMKGVVMVTSEGNWLAGKDLLVKNGFETVEELPPFSLMVKKFKKAPNPSFPGDFDKRTSAYKKGFTVIRTDQCPYIDDAATIVKETAAELKLPYKEVELKSAADVRKFSPAPFGVFSIILNGKLLSYCYQLKKDLIQKTINF